MKTRKCDIGFVKSKGFLPNAIVFFQKLQDGEATFNHTYLFKNQRAIIEAQFGRGVKQDVPEKYKKDKVEIYRPLFLTDQQQENLIELAEYVIGQPYAKARIILNILDSIFKTYKFTKRFSITNFFECGNLIGWLFKNTPKEKTPHWEIRDIAWMKNIDKPRINYCFGTLWKSATPDSIYDWIKQHPDQWEQVS